MGLSTHTELRKLVVKSHEEEKPITKLDNAEETVSERIVEEKIPNSI